MMDIQQLLSNETKLIMNVNESISISLITIEYGF